MISLLCKKPPKRDNSFSTYATFSEKLTLPSDTYTYVLTFCVRTK